MSDIIFKLPRVGDSERVYLPATQPAVLVSREVVALYTSNPFLKRILDHSKLVGRMRKSHMKIV